MSGSILEQIANPATVNPLANYKAALDVSSGINQNALFQAKRAQGLAFQNALDPDGSVNQARYLQNLKNDPNAALGSLEAAQGGSTLAGTEQEQMIKRMGIMTGLAASKLATGQPISKEDWIATMKGAVGSHAFTPAQIDAQAVNIPDATPQNPYAVNDWLRGHVTAFINPQQQKLAYGEQGDVTGQDGSKIGTRRDPYTGAITAAPGPGVQQGMTPIEESTPTQIGVTAKGAPIMGTRKQFADQAKGVVQSPLGDGRNIPIALTNPANRQLAGVVTGQDPATAAAQTETGGNSAKEFQNISQQGVQARARGAILDNLLSDTSQFSPGPGADALLKVRQIGGVLGFPVDKDATSASESFTKLVSQINAAQGAGSDARLSVAQAGNVHKDLSPQGVDLLLRQLRGNEDYNNARAKLAQAYPDKANSAGFEDKFGANLDPRAFQFARMQPGKQRNDYFDAIKDKATFKKSYIWAETHGLIGGGNAGQ